MATVETMTGPIETEELGPTLMHEHVFTLDPDYVRNYGEGAWWNEEDEVAGAVDKLRHLATKGITRIERVMTDNAFAYRHSHDVKEACADLGATQLFIKPHCPWQNGKVERLNRTLATEWAYRRSFASNAERAAALAPWLEHYNTVRRHSSLGGKSPISRLRPT